MLGNQDRQKLILGPIWKEIEIWRKLIKVFVNRIASEIHFCLLPKTDDTNSRGTTDPTKFTGHYSLIHPQLGQTGKS